MQKMFPPLHCYYRNNTAQTITGSDLINYHSITIELNDILHTLQSACMGCCCLVALVDSLWRNGLALLRKDFTCQRANTTLLQSCMPHRCKAPQPLLSVQCDVLFAPVLSTVSSRWHSRMPLLVQRRERGYMQGQGCVAPRSCRCMCWVHWPISPSPR